MERESSSPAWKGRKIELEGTVNFRDFGGYQTEDGRYVKTGLLYRSDGLYDLTDADVEKVRALGIRTIVDYRNPGEISKLQDREIPGAVYRNLDPRADAAALASDEKGQDRRGLTAQDAWRLMTVQNEQFVLCEDSVEAYRTMLRLVMDPERVPLVQHCRGGKDRTGYGAALILLLLGVPRETVMADYLLTNVYKRAKNDARLEKVRQQTGNEDMVQAVRYMTVAYPEFLDRAIDTMLSRYGTAEDYVKTVMGFSEEELTKFREIYLER